MQCNAVGRKKWITASIKVNMLLPFFEEEKKHIKSMQDLSFLLFLPPDALWLLYHYQRLTTILSHGYHWNERHYSILLWKGIWWFSRWEIIKSWIWNAGAWWNYKLQTTAESTQALSLQEIKYHVGVNVRMFSEALKMNHLQLFTHELCLCSRSIWIALCVKMYLLHQS